MSKCFKRPEMKYGFVDDVLIGYEKLHTNDDGLEITTSESEKRTWRDDCKFLFELCVPYQFPKIKW